MHGLKKWSLVAFVFVGLTLATLATAEAGRRVRVRYVRPVHAHYYAAPVVVHAHPVHRVYVPVRRVHYPHAVYVAPPAVHVYHGPRVVTPWVTVW
jgi:hypothetical protein